MFETYEILFGILGLIFILLYTLQFILYDLYSFCNNNSIRVNINKIIPFFAKNNSLFLLLSFIFSVLHLIFYYSCSTLFNSGYLIVCIIILLLVSKAFSKKFMHLKIYLEKLPYLLLISLLVHIFFR